MILVALSPELTLHCRFFLHRFSVACNLFCAFFIVVVVTPCLVVTVQPCMEWIPIKIKLKDGWSAENLIQYQTFGVLKNYQSSYSGTICSTFWNAAPWLLIKIGITPSKLFWRCLFAKLKTMSPSRFPWKIKVINSEYYIFQKCIWDINQKEDSVFEQKTDSNNKGWVIKTGNNKKGWVI